MFRIITFLLFLSSCSQILYKHQSTQDRFDEQEFKRYKRARDLKIRESRTGLTSLNEVHNFANSLTMAKDTYGLSACETITLSTLKRYMRLFNLKIEAIDEFVVPRNTLDYAYIFRYTNSKEELFFSSPIDCDDWIKIRNHKIKMNPNKKKLKKWEYVI